MDSGYRAPQRMPCCCWPLARRPATASGDHAGSGAAKPHAGYSDPASLFSLLREPEGGGLAPVKLVRCSWLLSRAAQIAACTSDAERAALALPRRQDLEMLAPNAFLSSAEVEALPRSTGSHNARSAAKSGHVLRVLSVSHCWATALHPDPHGHTLVALAEAINRMRTVPVPAVEPGYRFHTLPEEELAVFFDWTALPQKDGAAGLRSAAEQTAFDRALASMELWYAHRSVTTVLMTSSEGIAADSLPYDARGWPSFERRVALIAKPTSEHHWPLLVDAGAADGTCARWAPLSPASFSAELQSKAFTNGADREVCAP